MNQPPGTNVAISSNPCAKSVEPAHGVGVGVPPPGVGVGVTTGVAVAVAVAVGVGVMPGVGVGPHEPPDTTIVSTRHPVPVTLESEPIRNRNLIDCPFTFGPRLAMVLI